jgi:hypothetical protein
VIHQHPPGDVEDHLLALANLSFLPLRSSHEAYFRQVVEN